MDATAELVLSFYGERWVLTVAETYGELPSKKKGVLLLGSHKKKKKMSTILLFYPYSWSQYLSAAAAAKSLQSCPTLCNSTDSMQPTRFPRPWDSPGKNTGMGCHFLLQCMQVKSEREGAQSCPTLCDPGDCSLPGSSICGIFHSRVLEWVSIYLHPFKCISQKSHIIFELFIFISNRSHNSIAPVYLPHPS